MKFFQTHSRIRRKLVAGLLVCIISLSATLAPISRSLEVQRAEAVPVEEVGANLVQNTLSKISGFLSSGALTSLNTKEYVLDGIAYALAKKAISMMTADLVRWINSGFQGSPAFITDLGGFLTGVADQVAGKFLTDAGLGFVCSPFRLDVKAALNVQYQQTRNSPPQCTLSSAVGNIENFVRGSFAEGGWGGWFSMTAIPQNNPFGAIVLAQYKLNASIQNAQGQELKLLDFGNGFLSWKKCTGEGTAKKCTIQTPGNVISEALNSKLQLGDQALINADEINEVISALLGQLMNQAVTTVDGLAGLSQNDASGSSYLDQLKNDEGPRIGATNGDQNPIARSIEIENEMIDHYETVIGLVDALEADIAGAGPGCSITLPKSLRDARTFSQEAITSIGSVLVTLNELLVDYNAATDPIVKGTIYNQYADLQATGYIHTEEDLANLYIDKEYAVTIVSEFRASLPPQCKL